MAEPNELPNGMAYAFYDIAHEGAQVRAVAGVVGDKLLEGLKGMVPRSVVVYAQDGISRAATNLAVAMRSPLEYPVVTVNRLPRYVGPLDVIVVLTERADDPQLAADIQVALQRGCTVIFAGLSEGPLVEDVAGRGVVIPHLPTAEGTSPLRALATVRAVLDSLHGEPLIIAQTFVDWASEVDLELEACSPEREEVVNPARELAYISGRIIHLGSDPIGDAIAHLACRLWSANGKVSVAFDREDWALSARKFPVSDSSIFDDPIDGGGNELLPLKLIVWNPGVDSDADYGGGAITQSVPVADYSNGSALPLRLVARAWAATAF